MPWCPNCKEEYRDGFLKCSQCGATLVNKLPQVDSNQSDNTSDQRKIDLNVPIDPCLLISVTDEIQAKLIEGVLLDSNIPFYIKDRECGGFLKVYMGFSVFGTDIYVEKNNYDKAKEIIDACFAESDNDNDYEPLDEKDNRSFRVRKAVMRIVVFILLLPIAFSILSVVFSIINQFVGHR